MTGTGTPDEASGGGRPHPGAADDETVDDPASPPPPPPPQWLDEPGDAGRTVADPFTPAPLPPASYQEPLDDWTAEFGTGAPRPEPPPLPSAPPAGFGNPPPQATFGQPPAPAYDHRADPAAPAGYGDPTPHDHAADPAARGDLDGLAAQADFAMPPTPYVDFGGGQPAPQAGFGGAAPRHDLGQAQQQGQFAQPAPYGQGAQFGLPSGPPALPAPPSPGVAPAPGVPYEPWRLSAPRRQGPRFGVRKVLLVAAAGVVAVGVVAAAVIVFVTRDGGSTERDEESRLAGGVFTGDPAVTADGRDQELTGVAAAGSTVVAVGGETDHITQRAQFLVSTDAGRSFRLAPTRSTSGEEPPPGDVLRHVATSSRGWVAIGDRLGGTVVWISRDGRIWTRQPEAAGAPFGPGTQVNRVAGTAGGFIAVGATSRKGDFSDSVPALWLSEDGRNWERRAGDQLGLSARGGTLSLVDATANGGTILIQGVHTRRPGARNPDARNMVWRSEDAGRSWTESKIRAPKGTMGLSIGGGPAGFVAVREIRDGAGAYAQPFTSDDGETWTQADKIAVSGHRRIMRLLASDQWQFAVVEAAGRAVLVRGRSGEPWQEAGTMPMAPGRSLLSAAVTGDTTIVAGRDLTGRDINAILTVSAGGGPPTGIDLGKVPGAVREDQVVRALSAPGADGSGGGRAVAVGGTNGDAAAWTSTDGTKWQRARPEGDAFARPGRQRLGDVASGGAGWLAVGSDGVSPVRPLVVTSADGLTWKTSAGADVFQPRQGVPLATNAAAAAQPGYVIVGEDGTTAAAWFSADLRTWEKGVAAGRDALGGPDTWMRGVTGGPFGFVAVGGRRDPAVRDAPNARPAIWTSADGRRWAAQPLPLPSGFTEGSLEYIAAKDRLLVAAGTAATPEGPRPLAYMSADGGRTWQETKIPGDERAVVSAMTATPNGFLAAGTSGAPGTGDAVLWTSRDGRAWQPLRPKGVGLSGAGEQELTGLTVLGGRLTGVGATRSHRGETPTLWLRPIP